MKPIKHLELVTENLDRCVEFSSAAEAEKALQYIAAHYGSELARIEGRLTCCAWAPIQGKRSRNARRANKHHHLVIVKQVHGQPSKLSVSRSSGRCDNQKYGHLLG